MYGPRPLRKKGETGSEGDLDYIPGAKVRPKLRRDNEKGPSDSGPVRMHRGAPGELIRHAPGMRAPVPIVPSQPRRPLHRAPRPGGPQGQGNPGILVQPLKKTTPGVVDPREPVKKKYAIVKKIPQSQEQEKAGGYNSCSIGSSKSSNTSTSTASTVKSSSFAPSVHEDSDLEGSVA